MTSRFRPEYRDLSAGEKETVALIKDTADTLAHWITYHSGDHGPNREARIALTKLEEAVMWGVKGITG